MSNLNSNIPAYFSIAFVALATGFYLGQTIPQLSGQEENKPLHPKKGNKNVATSTDHVTDKEAFNSEEEEESEEDSDYEIESLAVNDIPGEVRMALVIRTDLKMEKGKVAAQCAHAALGCFRLIATDPSKKSYNPLLTNRWLHGGQAKITLKCQNKEMMDELYAKALSLDVNAVVIHDAGRTQIAAGSATVLGIGPAPKSVLDQITGDLKLY